MAGFGSDSPYWNQQDVPYQSNFYAADFNQFQNQHLEFKPLEEYGEHTYNTDFTSSFAPVTNSMLYADPKEAVAEEFDEPPLLEELEIYPDRILEKVTAVLNPFRSHGLADDAEYLTKDSDLVGPVVFYLILAACLFVTGNKANFGYIYGVSVLSCFFMYFLLTLMTAQDSVFTVITVASVLGYCILPIVGLSVIGIFISLQGIVGIVIAILGTLWSCVSASRLFVTISGDKEQQPLIAYPCALVYGIYVLLVVF